MDFVADADANVSLIVKGAMPAGLTLNGSSGLISGTPKYAGTYGLTLMVEDSSVAGHTGLPQRFIVPYSLVVEN